MSMTQENGQIVVTLKKEDADAISHKINEKKRQEELAKQEEEQKEKEQKTVNDKAVQEANKTWLIEHLNCNSMKQDALLEQLINYNNFYHVQKDKFKQATKEHVVDIREPQGAIKLVELITNADRDLFISDEGHTKNCETLYKNYPQEVKKQYDTEAIADAERYDKLVRAFVELIHNYK